MTAFDEGLIPTTRRATTSYRMRQQWIAWCGLPVVLAIACQRQDKPQAIAPLLAGERPASAQTAEPGRITAPAEPDALFPILMRLAERGIPEAQYHVGMMYNNGYGVQKDLAKAWSWFQRAATAGDPLAEYKVGCYYAGQAPGIVPEDHSQALTHKLVAAKAGYALAQYDVGIFYYKQGNVAEARRWWTMASEQGFPMAAYSLGATYKTGEESANPVLAYAYFKLAKLAMDGQLTPNASAVLGELAAGMSAADLAAAERVISDFKPRPTALTTKALSGVRAARELIEVTK